MTTSEAECTGGATETFHLHTVFNLVHSVHDMGSLSFARCALKSAHHRVLKNTKTPKHQNNNLHQGHVESEAHQHTIMSKCGPLCVF